MRMVVRAAGLSALAVLAACASGGTPEIELAQRAQTALVGLSEAQLLSCAGVPNRKATAGGAEYLTYTARPDVAANSPVESYGFGDATSEGLGEGLSLGIGVPEISSQRMQGCDATFVLRGGVVQQLTYPMGANLENCGAIVRNCMPR